MSPLKGFGVGVVSFVIHISPLKGFGCVLICRTMQFYELCKSQISFANCVSPLKGFGLVVVSFVIHMSPLTGFGCM